MNEHLKRRLLALGALSLALGVIGWFSMSAMNDDLVYYLSPTELLAKGDAGRNATVRIMGVVEPGSVDWRPEEQILRFRIDDGDHALAIEGRGAPPQMFREGIGVVIEGQLGSDDIFRSYDVMVKHDNEYRPPEEGERPSDLYGTLLEES